MPSPHFHPLHPRSSLRRLRTAFTPSSPATTFTSTSPLSTTTRASSNFSTFNFNFSTDNLSSLSVSTTRRVIRRKKSLVEAEQEEERHRFGTELVGVVEPRPFVGASLDGIQEVLEGRV